MNSSNIFYSECLIDSAKVPLPSKIVFGSNPVRYNVHFYVQKGQIKIWYDSESNEPSLKLYNGAKWNAKHTDCAHENIIIKPYMCKEIMVWITIEL